MRKVKSNSVLPVKVSHRKERGKKMARYLLRCGCCDAKLEIHYYDDIIEINGVIGSIDNWRKILNPILGGKHGSKNQIKERNSK